MILSINIHTLFYIFLFFIGEIKSNSHDMQMKQTETYKNSKITHLSNAPWFFGEQALMKWTLIDDVLEIQKHSIDRFISVAKSAFIYVW